MSDKFVSERNVKFLLYEVLDAESLSTCPHYEEHNREIFDIVLETALKIGKDLLRPFLQEMDQNPPELVDGKVRVHPMVKTFMKECGEGGWIAANAPYELDGQQLPLIITSACRFIFAAANYSASVFPMLTTGSAHLIENFGSQELIDAYIPNMFAGKWQGTMALTEPQAGSSLADITSQAEPTDQGWYKMRGQKIFISAGDHDGVENVVHLMLAKIKGAPAGVKGISLFVVPNKRPGDTGELVFNDVNIAGIYHKLGYRGTPLTQLSLGENDDCRGWLVGEPHKGLSYMFQMMNEARLDVGMGAAAIASAAYYASLEYASDRPQGRKLSAKDPALPQVPIIEHPDVKRMLLFQRSIVEGALALILQCSKYADLCKCSEGEEMERYELLLDLLTPVAKSYPSEMGIHSVSQAIQCLGGYGFCDEYPIEQLYRDARIHPIHEGTTGIQGLDLLGRKVVMKESKAFSLFLQNVQAAIQASQDKPCLADYGARLQQSVEQLKTVTEHLLRVAREGDREVFLADSTLYLEFFGLIAIGWQWLKQGLAAEKGLGSNPSQGDVMFYQGKLFTMRFFFHYELPKIQGLATRLMENDGLTVEMERRFFAD